MKVSRQTAMRQFWRWRQWFAVRGDVGALHGPGAWNDAVTQTRRGSYV